MSVWTGLRNLLRSETHSIDKRALWGQGADIGEPVHAGVVVSQEGALKVSAVNRCIGILSGTVGSLPWDIHRRKGEAREEVLRPPAWLETPNPETTAYEFKERIVESLAMDGNAFILITARDATGWPAEMWTLLPRDVDIRRSDSGVKYYTWQPDQTRLSNFSAMTPLGDLLHIKLPSGGGLRGWSPLEQQRQSIGLSLVSEKFGARFFGRGQTMSGVIQLPATEPNKSRQHIDLMREMWEQRHGGTDNAHRPGILTGGAEWKQLSITPEEAQFLETRRFQVEEIARWYGIPPHMVGAVERSTSWGSGIEEQSLGFLRFTLMPWLVRIEHAMSQLVPRGQFMKFNQRALIRGTALQEADVLAKYVTNGLMDRAEARSLLELEPRPGLDRFLLPLNMQILERNGEPVPDTPADIAPREIPNAPRPS